MDVDIWALKEIRNQVSNDLKLTFEKEKKNTVFWLDKYIHNLHHFIPNINIFRILQGT